jgi:D-alanine-D-alanine ligase
MIQKHIEIVVSSRQRSNSISLTSQQSLQTTLARKYTSVIITKIGTYTDVERLIKRKPDLVIPGTRYMPAIHGGKAWSVDVLNSHGIVFTGSDKDAIILQAHKQNAKQAAIDNGILSARYFVAQYEHSLSAHSLTYPLFVKPTNRCHSTGINELSVVYDSNQLRAQITAIGDQYKTDLLVEEYLPGREFSVAVLRRPKSTALHAMPIEIIAPIDGRGNMFLSRLAKDTNNERVIAVCEGDVRDHIKGACYL